MPPVRPRKKAAPAKGKSPKTGMKLAEALILRADAQKRVEQLKQRLLRSAKVQEGDPPSEDPSALVRELNLVAAELLSLIQRINRTNSATRLSGGETMSDALAVRDVLKIRQGVYRDLAAAAAVTQDRRTQSEVKFKSAVSVAKMQKQADELAKAHRELDAKIQAANWEQTLHE